MMKFFAIFCVLLCMTSAATAATITVGLTDNQFSSSSRTIEEGDTVEWVWDTANEHNVAQVDSATATVHSSGFRSGEPTLTGSYSRTFDIAGTYYCICEPHILPPDNMRMQIVVVEADDGDDGSSGCNSLLPMSTLLVALLVFIVAVFFN
jgi:plastocyanin